MEWASRLRQRRRPINQYMPPAHNWWHRSIPRSPWRRGRDTRGQRLVPGRSLSTRLIVSKQQAARWSGTHNNELSALALTDDPEVMDRYDRKRVNKAVSEFLAAGNLTSDLCFGRSAPAIFRPACVRVSRDAASMPCLEIIYDWKCNRSAAISTLDCISC